MVAATSRVDARPSPCSLTQSALPAVPAASCPALGGPLAGRGSLLPCGGLFQVLGFVRHLCSATYPESHGDCVATPCAATTVLPPSGDPTASPVPTSAAGVRGSARPSRGFCPGADVRFREAAPEPLVTKPSSASHGRRAVSASRRDRAHVLGCAVGGGGPQTPLPEGPRACGTDLRARCRGDRRLLRARSWAGG